MAPEPPSPSASAALLPFLGTRSRRGSLASITSRREVDKDVLAQALDQIHNSASKSDALTSFHDFDGGGRAGAKEIVSNGVSGLYNRLKQSVGGGTPAKDTRGRPRSSASKDSVETDSIQSSRSIPKPSPALFLKKSAPDAVSISTASVAASPLLASFSGISSLMEHLPQAPNGRPRSPESHEPRGETRLPDFGPMDQVVGAPLEDLSQEDMDCARGALLDDDRGETATQALARVLSHHELQISDRLKPQRIVQFGEDRSTEITSLDEMSARAVTAPQGGQSNVAGQSQSAPGLKEGLQSPREQQRPSMVHVGPSHLPGFKPSRASSTTDGGDVSSASTAHGVIGRPRSDPLLNINGALQRRRTGPKPPPSIAQPAAHVSSHLKRRVISKEFWMRDENAKDCFYCGQSFSTFRRKHHCRTCGQIFDAKCTSLVAGRPFGQPDTLRLCKPCEAMVYGSDDDSTVFSDDDDDIARSPLARGSFSEDDQFPGAMDGGAFNRTDAREVATPSMGIPASRRNRESKQRSAVIEFDAAPKLARPSSSHSLISLSRRPRSSSHRRHQSRHQNLRGLRSSVDERGPFHQELGGDPEKRPSLPAFHNDNIIDPDLAPFLSGDETDEEDRPNIMSALETSASLSREGVGISSLFASAVKKGRSRLGDRGTTAHSARGVAHDDGFSPATKRLPKLTRKRNPSIGSITPGRPSPRRSRSNLLVTTVESDSLDQRPTSQFPPPDSFGSKIVRSSAMHGPDAPPVELNSASLGHVRKLLSQCLRDVEVEAVKAWEKALVPILLQCTDDVKPDVKKGDDMDVRHYIKLKKVPGGRPGDTSYVSGIVFSKNVALKSMARSIRSPRIAIVTFSIEYARHQTHFMSLEPVIAQEREYLHNLVGRIAALKPQLLLVQRNVSGLALRLLEEAGITVAFNIKESVLAAVARVTQTTMIKSVDKLTIGLSHLGGCDSFEVKTYMYQGVRKTYIYLSGCFVDLGCTIVLRGADTKTLRKIKRVTEFMCYVVYNLKLETTLMRDEFVSVPSSPREQTTAHGHHGRLHDTQGALMPHLVKAQSDIETPSKYEEMEERCRSRVLSASPFVVFMQPHLLTQLRESEVKLTTYKKLRDQYAAADEDGDDEKLDADIEFALVHPETANTLASKDQPKTVREYLHAVHQAQYEKTLHTYETQKRLWESFVAGSSDLFDPLSHQTIEVLHSTVSSITSAPCVGPELLGMGFYASYNSVEADLEEDCTLGQYVEDLCLSASSICKACGKRMYDHHRQYVHGYGQLSISVQRQAGRVRGYNDTLLMWSSCRICRAETALVPMSENTWKYSFAKYLELSFWSSPLHPRAGVCEHDIHKDFLRYFGYQDLVVRVQYDAVEIYDVVVPRSTVTWKVESDLLVKNEQFSHFLARLNAFTGSIRKRLDSINVDTLDEKKSIEAHEKLDALRKHAEEDHQDLLHKLQLKYASSRYYELIPLNRALRFMDEKAIAWDEEFNNFERDYFPSETDIRKLATLQLRNMFLESQPSSSSIASDTSDTEEGTEMSPIRPRLTKQLLGEELQSEKAHDVMTSAVEEHRHSQDDSVKADAVEDDDAVDSLGSSLNRMLSPREGQEAIERTDVKHLDLALPARSPDDTSGEDLMGSIEQSGQTSGPAAGDGEPDNEPFALPPKPLSSGLLERIEQIRSTRAAGGSDGLEQPQSKIPRLAALPRRDISPIPSPPPLLRAKSQPSHVPRRSIDMSSVHSIDSVASGGLQTVPEMPPIDKRLGERLGISRLANKTGKAIPSLIPRSIPSKSDESTSTKVSALAKHFEQMSREFEKERLRERRQRAMRSRQARANPLASSTPVVEVYRNATDAVGERSFDEASQGQQTDGDDFVPMTTSSSAPPTQTTSSDDPLERQLQELQSSDETVEHQQPRLEDNDSVDMDPIQVRSRDASDPISGLSSSTLLSPSLVPDMELSITDHRKNVWFKYLADFWSKRSASGWTNLEYPLHPTEHVFEDSDIIVREDEPSSVIALSLACADYVDKVQDFRSHPSKQGRKHAHSASQASSGFITAPDEQQKAIEASLLSDTGTHMKYSFAHGSVKASCKIFYAESFDALRRRCGVADRFVESLSRCLKYDSKGGKTKSLFLKTLDNRFIIKSLQEVELKAFTKFAPDYFAFMSYTLFHGVPSVIAKMFGLFQVIIKNPVTGLDFSYYLLVMENLFYDRNPNRRFDLKGSMRNRKIESTGQPDEVLLDENLVETIFESPLFVREHARKLVQASVWNDTMWLCKQNVMDYSLMAGFDDERKELVVGIIDCIRTYTWDKKLESWIKDRGKNKPTITSPRDYRNRFRVSMMQYILAAPNHWHQFQAVMAPPKTLRENQEETEDTDAERYQGARSRENT
ncbi:hypothetical protein LTR08_005614 [Meristemomyces frigidus]|nr:hypothetical protein LTR08_005614 [Meristemomyces frigidus]